MAKKISLRIEKEKKRIPVPKKPPKIEEGRKQYNRNKAKKEKEKLLEERGNMGKPDKRNQNAE